MQNDIELMRALLLALEPRQLSPRNTVLLTVDELAEDLGRDPSAVKASLDLLLALEYIDGGGEDESGFWFFRKLTRKGVEFLRQARSAKDWARMKQHYGRSLAASDG